MRTARITFLVEFPDKGNPPTVRHFSDFGTATLNVDNATVVGAPTVEVDKHHRTSLSTKQISGAIANIEAYGGSFARALGEAWLRADATNRQKLLAEFHDFIWKYVPTR